jgi:hypothetical protein
MKVTAENLRFADSIVVEESIRGFRVRPVLQTKGMLSPGLDESCSSSDRNRLPNRSSLKSPWASS